MSRPIALTTSSFLIISLIAFEAPAHADIDVAGALSAGASNRDDDGVGHAALRARYGFTDTLSVAGSLIGGAGQNDDRTIGAFSIAGELGKSFGRWRPALRLGFIHQHETAREDAEADPITVGLGVSEAIRHRTGAIAELGGTATLTPLWRGELFAAADLGGHVMFDKNGPRSYVLVTFGLGLRFAR